MLRVKSLLGRAVLVCASAFVSAGCGGPLQYAMRGSPRAAGADASLQANVDRDQSSTRLDARATNLAPPDRIQEGATVFVVWQRRDGSQQWARLGTLAYDPGSRVGEMRNVTVPETRFELQITAEPVAQPGSPSANVVFSQIVGAAAS